MLLTGCRTGKDPHVLAAATLESADRAIWQRPDSVIARLVQACSGSLHRKTVLDLGAGTGYFTFRLAQQADSVLAIDIDPYFIQYLVARKDTNRYKNVTILPIDSAGTGISQLRADVVLIVDTWPLLAQRVQYAGRLHAVLRPAGSVLIVNPRSTPVQETLDELRRGGFRSFSVDSTLLPRQYMILAGSS